MPESALVLVDVDSLSKDELRSLALGELNRRAKIGAARTGSPVDDETRRKIGDGVRRSWAVRKAHRTESGDDEIALASAYRLIEAIAKKTIPSDP